LEIASEIQEVLRPPCNLNGNAVFTSCSIGIALSTDRHRHAEELLREADTAMYRAKLEGRARHEVFDSGMHAQAVERLRLDSRLRQALDRGEFELYYQPVFGLAAGIPLGAEALIRWNHPEQGCLAPARFLAVAEEVGLAIRISQWVINTACREAKLWQRPGEPARYVNINLPAQHLKDPGLVDYIEQTLSRHALPPQALGIELVESTLIENQKSVIFTLRALRALGVRTAVDDFGTGYSSLSYLKRFPIDVLKIDRSFVHGVPGDVYDCAIAGAIITMAHDLKLTVVAEGVETPAQVRFLRAHLCDSLQGFLLSRPLPAPECREFLRSPTRSQLLLELTA
jgi:EAL domain-containing protein (putative c-di-GMP-specific phosphodiesterase class I)